jgi:hypothetical protein
MTENKPPSDTHTPPPAQKEDKGVLAVPIPVMLLRAVYSEHRANQHALGVWTDEDEDNYLTWAKMNWGKPKEAWAAESERAFLLSRLTAQPEAPNDQSSTVGLPSSNADTIIFTTGRPRETSITGKTGSTMEKLDAAITAGMMSADQQTTALGTLKLRSLSNIRDQ